MFCNQCGTPLQADFNVCPKCGQPAGRPLAPYSQGQLQRHLKTLGVLWIILGVLFLLPACFLLGLSGVAHNYIPASNPLAWNLGPFLISLAGGFLLLLAGGGICVGWGLMQHAPWARIAAIILGILSLFHFPIGTALGIYTLWVLLANDAAYQYEQMARAA